MWNQRSTPDGSLLSSIVGEDMIVKAGLYRPERRVCAERDFDYFM